MKNNNKKYRFYVPTFPKHFYPEILTFGKFKKKLEVCRTFGK